MPKTKKYKRINKKPKRKKSVKNSIYKSNINKQSVKVHINNPSSAPSSGVKYMNTPSYPNLTDINSTIKGTVEELLKKHHHEQPRPSNNPPPINNPLNIFENRNQNMYPLGDILRESEKKKDNHFTEYDNGSPLDSSDYDDDKFQNLFIQREPESESFFETPLKVSEEPRLSIRKSQLPVRKTPFQADKKTGLSERQEYIGSEYNPKNDEEKKPTIKEKRQQIRQFHDQKLPEETPVKTKKGLISIPQNKDKLKK